jgi:NAD+ kinase
MDNFTFVTKPTEAVRQIESIMRQTLAGIEVRGSFVIAIGGDGTMLQAVKEHLHQDVIFIGISAGSLGLLQTITQDQLPILVEALKTDTYELLKSPLLQVSYCDPAPKSAQDDQVTEIVGYGFNDISIERQDTRAAKFRLNVDRSAGNFVGDGVIFSTPLGSTAYSLAAGGPIIDSEIQDVFVVTPNNPHISNLHSSLYRPHVLSGKRKIRIELIDEDMRPILISIDGQVAARDVTRPLQISLSDKFVQILQLEKDSLHKQIEEKRLGRL